MILEQIMLTGLLVYFTVQVINAGLKTNLQSGREIMLTAVSLVSFAAFLLVALFKIWS